MTFEIFDLYINLYKCLKIEIMIIYLFPLKCIDFFSNYSTRNIRYDTFNKNKMAAVYIKKILRFFVCLYVCLACCFVV